MRAGGRRVGPVVGRRGIGLLVVAGLLAVVAVSQAKGRTIPGTARAAPVPGPQRRVSASGRSSLLPGN